MSVSISNSLHVCGSSSGATKAGTVSPPAVPASISPVPSFPAMQAAIAAYQAPKLDGAKMASGTRRTPDRAGEEPGSLDIHSERAVKVSGRAS